MSIITEGLPESLLIRGQTCPINTDFKVWLRVSELLAANITDAEKTVQIFRTVFGPNLPPNLYDAMREIMQFYACVKGVVTDEKEAEKAIKKSYFDFEYDADLIYASFFHQYHVDLCSVSMHWWKFKALLSGLSEDTQFIKVVQYRCVDLSKIKDREQRAFYASMKKLHKLPDKRSEEQKEQQLNQALEMLF